MRSFAFETQKKSFSESPRKKKERKNKETDHTPNHAESKTPYLIIRTRYPVFSPCDDETLGEPRQEKAFCEKINRFYAQSAAAYVSSPPAKTLKKAAVLAAANQKPCSFVWHTEVPYNGQNAVSLFTDISGFDGEKNVKRRFGALWSAKDGTLITPSQVFFTDARHRKAVIRQICAIAESNLHRGIFTYYDNFEAIKNKRFSFDSFYFVPNGAAFYFDGGVLSSHTDEVTVFVLPFEKAEGLLKLVPES